VGAVTAEGGAPEAYLGRHPKHHRYKFREVSKPAVKVGEAKKDNLGI